MFYDRTLGKLLKSGQVSTTDSVLVSCGGTLDKEILSGLGFSNVTITNLDSQYGEYVAPFKWERQDAEKLAYQDKSFDVAIVHAGLHHCHSPHRALLELYRVARKAVIVFEARDSLAMKIANRFGLTPDYELEAVSGSGYEIGGVNNGPIPNFIYRWTEREVIKTIQSFDPAHKSQFDFYYGLRLPTHRLDRTNRTVMRAALNLIAPAAKAFASIFPKQGNEFCFAIFKTGEVRPWIENKNGQLGLSREKAMKSGRHLAALTSIIDPSVGADRYRSASG